MIPCSLHTRKNHSTETAIAKIRLDEGQCTVLASLHLFAVLGTVDHDLLLHCLGRHYGIRGVAYQWFSSYLSDRQIKICINSSSSESRILKCGISQGLVLGARLYTIYSRKMEGHNVRYHSYADNTQVYLKCGNNEAAVRHDVGRLEKCISDLCEWMKCNSLRSTKTKRFVLFLVHTLINIII